MTARRKALVAAGAVFGSLLAALVVLPILFQDRIAERMRAGIDDALDARVEWSGIGLTFFRDFPDLTFRLDDLDVGGTGPFEGERLASMESFRLVLDVGSVIRALWRNDSIVVRSVHLDRPDLRLRVLEDGTANWDIVRDRPGEPEDERDERPGRDLRIALHELTVDGGTLLLDDERAGLSATLEGLDHSLRGDFARDRLVVRTRTRSDRASLHFGGVPYLDDVALHLTANVDADMVDERFTLDDNELRLNELALSFSGNAARTGDGLVLDLTASAPDAALRRILSLVPALHRRDFETLEAGGAVSVDGHLRGTVSKETFPAFEVNVTVGEGWFRYPALPLPARNIALDLSVTNPGDGVDGTVLTLDPFHLEIGGEPIDGALAVRTPVSDPDVDLRVRGSLDLADVPRTVPLETVEELAGTVVADASVRARMSDVEGRQYDRIAARGTVSARGVAVRTADLPHPMEVEEAALVLSPDRAEVTELRARVGASDLEGTGRVDNLLGFALRDEALEGTAMLRSRRFDLDEWRSDEPDREVIPVPGRLDLVLDAAVEELTYGDLVMADVRGTVRVADRRVSLENVRGATLGGMLGLSGFYDTTDPSRPTFVVDLDLDSLDVSAAATTLLTVRTLAPAARYARGTFSADLSLDGALGPDMAPVFDVLDGRGIFGTSTLVLEDFPMLERLADALEIPELKNPTLQSLRSSVAIRDGRLHVRPFEVEIGNLTMNVWGSNGVDQSLDYTLALAVPRSALGSRADRVVRDLIARAGTAGVELEADDLIEIGVRVTGTVRDPAVELDFGRVLESARDRVGAAAVAEAERRIEAAEREADEARQEALRRARARADSLVAEAEERAEAIREGARAHAQELRDEGERRAEEVLARATDPVTLAAARPVAEAIRREANERAGQIVGEADARADGIVADARARADAIVEAAGGGAPRPR